MKTKILIASTVLFAAHASAQTTRPAAPVAGKAQLGVAVVEMDAVVAGWSAKRDIIKKAVVNEKMEKIGTVEDVIITPKPDAGVPAATFAIIGVGGFLGMGRHEVAVPTEQIKFQEGKLMLAGASKDALKALPKFEYRK